MNPGNKKVLFLFTDTYPYSFGEAFLENEVLFLSRYFEKIIVFSSLYQGEIRKIPENVIVYDTSFLEFKKCITLKGINQYFTFFLFYIQEIWRSPKRKSYIGSYRKEFSRLLKQKIQEANFLKFVISNYSIHETYFYSYWFNHWVLILSILKKWKTIQTFFCKCHGYDLFNERSYYGFFPFRYSELSLIENVFFASRAGLNYMSEKFQSYKDKFKLSHLGVYDKGLNPFNPNKELTIVSCSNVIGLKRIDKIIEVLNLVKCKVKWVHFGSGELLDDIKLKAKKLPENITPLFKGPVANNQIIKYYQNNSIDLFITLTSSEGGVPVSIQEAMSFGIPVIATNVGGISEIHNKDTGYLVDKEFDVSEVVEIINEFKKSKFYDYQTRKKIKQHWKNDFDAEKNFTIFLNEILKE